MIGKSYWFLLDMDPFDDDHCPDRSVLVHRNRKNSRISKYDALIYAEIIIIISEALDLIISIFMINILGKTVDYLGETKRRNR